MQIRAIVIAAVFLVPTLAFDASAKTINACVKANGTLKIVIDPADCSAREASLSWNQQDPNATRFEKCGDGTVADHQTGLQWEKKTGTRGSAVVCETASCPDPHIVNNLYDWSNTGTAPDGGAFTDFLVKLNDQTFGTAASASDVTGCFAGHCDWRLPNIVELQTILDCGFGHPCIDPIFSPTASFSYWSASTGAGDPTNAWFAGFGLGFVGDFYKTYDYYVRAVRVGSCN